MARNKKEQNTTNLTNIANTKVTGNSSPIKPLSPQMKQQIIQNTLNTCPLTIGGLKITMVDVRALDVDLSYQRLTTTNIGKLIPIFDIEESDILELSYRDNKFYIIDGVHRGVAAIANGVPYLLAKIHTNWTQEQEARAFKDQNKNRTSLKPIEAFKAGIVAGDEIDCMVKAACDRYGLTITRNIKNVLRPMTALTAAQMIVKKCGNADTLLWTFYLMDEANWLTAPSATTAKHLNAFAAIHEKAKLEDMLAEYQTNILEFISKVNPQQFDSIAMTEYTHFDHRAAVHALLHDIAKGTITVTKYMAVEKSA